MKNSKLLTGTAVFSVAITAAVTTMSLTSAYRENANQKFETRGLQVSEEQRTAMQEALANKDYEAWLKLIPENSRKKEMTETEFEAFAETQLARIQEMEGKRAEREAQREALDEAFANNDYSAWLALMQTINSDSPLLEKITADNFATLVKAHNLRQEGEAKFAEADKILEEIGVEGMGGMGFGKGTMGAKMGKGGSGHCGFKPTENDTATDQE